MVGIVNGCWRGGNPWYILLFGKTLQHSRWCIYSIQIKKKKYIVRKNLYSEECTFNLECWRKSRKPWCCVPMTSFNMILERIRNRCFWYICDAGNLWKWRGFSIVEQMEQILYYLNLKYKKIYKKVILRENSKNICSICSMPWKALIFQCFLPEQMCERMCDT